MAVTSVMTGRLYFQYLKQGWQESFNLVSTDYGAAKTAMGTIVTARRKILPANASIIYGRVGFLGKPRDKKALKLSYPLAGQADTLTPAAGDDPNDVEHSVVVSYETAGGRWMTAHTRCIPDDMETGTKLVDALVIPDIVSGTFTPVSGTTWIAALGNYIATVGTLTQHVRTLEPLPGPPVVFQFEVNPFTDAIYRGMGSKSTGRVSFVQRGRAPVR